MHSLRFCFQGLKGCIPFIWFHVMTLIKHIVTSVCEKLYVTFPFLNWQQRIFWVFLPIKQISRVHRDQRTSLTTGCRETNPCFISSMLDYCKGLSLSDHFSSFKVLLPSHHMFRKTHQLISQVFAIALSASDKKLQCICLSINLSMAEGNKTYVITVFYSLLF